MAVPPEFDGVRDEIAVPFTPEIDVGLYEIFGAGTLANTSITIVEVLDPAEFDAVIT